MSTLPKITLSTTDHARLLALLERHPDDEVADGLAVELDRAHLVAPGRLPAAVVAMNRRVRFRHEDSGQEYCLELVYPHEADGAADRLSVLTPAGAALLGLTAGDGIEWPVAGKTARFRLLEVQPAT